jgi:RTX calcium-binding nonapeptide repeat (4 copies)
VTRVRSVSLVCCLIGLVAVTFPQTATAGTATVEVRETTDGPVAKLTFRAAPGEVNDITVCTTVEGQTEGCLIPEHPGPPSAYLVSGAPVEPGPGCHPDQIDARPVVRCPIPDGTRVTGPLLELGDGHDSAHLGPGTGPLYTGTGPLYAGAVMRGGDGNDYLWGGGVMDGGSGNDTIWANHWLRRGARLKGGSGVDSIHGGSGSDLIEPGPGRDEVDAGSGDDQIRSGERRFDSIRCGRGRDRTWLDGFDLGLHCERVVRRSGPPRAILFDFIDGPSEDPLSFRVACPIDMPRPCRITVTLMLRSGRRVGFARERLRPGWDRWVDVWPTGPVNNRLVSVTVRTLRGPRPPLKVTRGYRIDYAPGGEG